MSASQNKKKTLSLGLALIPVISMLLLLIIGYGIMGLRIEPLLLCSAAVAAGIAWWQGYCWEDIINSVVDKLAKAMPVIMILICVGGLIGTWMFSGFRRHCISESSTAYLAIANVMRPILTPCFTGFRHATSSR